MESFVWEFEEDTSRYRTAVSTLLLSPASAHFLRRNLLRNRKQFQGLLHHLIEKHKSSLMDYLSNLKQKKNLRIHYQEYRNKQKGYRRVHCRPSDREWAQIGLIANGFRVSRTFIISLLLEWERFARKKKVVRVPTSYSPISYHIRFHLFKQKRSFHFRL